MHIIVIGWLYVVLMMSIAEQSLVAGAMTFLLYGVLPLALIVYIRGASRRKRGRKEAEKIRREDA